MRKLRFLVFSLFIWQIACAGNISDSSEKKDVRDAKAPIAESNHQELGVETNVNDPSARVTSNSKNDSEIEIAPRTVRDFFMRLPNEYFVVESCDRKKDSNCANAKTKYLKQYLGTEDIRNGYLEAGGDGTQSTFKMAIFKRTNGSYLVGLNVFGEAENSSKFLNFNNRKWEDVSIEIVPEYSSVNIYEVPRKGTSVVVFGKRILEQREGFEISEKGEKLYELEWNGEEFSIKR